MEKVSCTAFPGKYLVNCAMWDVLQRCKGFYLLGHRDIVRGKTDSVQYVIARKDSGGNMKPVKRFDSYDRAMAYWLRGNSVPIEVSPRNQKWDKPGMVIAAKGHFVLAYHRNSKKQRIEYVVLEGSTSEGFDNIGVFTTLMDANKVFLKRSEKAG